ncbi:uncharacterized protein C8R40DRAFT_1065209 [Lentinula edodes]|uniref:uncharacterized protein n=1 Tax=Lentinula edodes TaxID=5353 RepID=UPI001E8CD73A|nr:uncharacterized protein C8R40DRAFT_1065209 [Lentinula edodes]KAH7881559.1 hypothetical protein C8R40DRAFT_1065209 [Lentinula edodes]
MAPQQMLFSEIFGSVQSYFILVMFEVLFLVLKPQSTTVLSIIEETHLTVLQINSYLEVHTSTLGLSFDDGSLFESYSILIVAQRGIYVAANIIADTILLYRCYLVWGSRKYVTPSLAILSLVNTVVAVFGVVLVAKNDQEQVIVQTEHAPAGPAIISLIFPSINLFTNLALTGLIAGRMWWLAHVTQQLLGVSKSHDKSIRQIVALMLESSSIYPVALIISMVVNQLLLVDTQPFLTIIVGIVPTLMLVKIELKIGIEDGSDKNVASNDLEALVQTVPPNGVDTITPYYIQPLHISDQDKLPTATEEHVRISPRKVKAGHNA